MLALRLDMLLDDPAPDVRGVLAAGRPLDAGGLRVPGGIKGRDQFHYVPGAYLTCLALFGGADRGDVAMLMRRSGEHARLERPRSGAKLRMRKYTAENARHANGSYVVAHDDRAHVAECMPPDARGRHRRVWDDRRRKR